jgi:hypothetical protein
MIFNWIWPWRLDPAHDSLRNLGRPTGRWRLRWNLRPPPRTSRCRIAFTPTHAWQPGPPELDASLPLISPFTSLASRARVRVGSPVRSRGGRRWYGGCYPVGGEARGIGFPGSDPLSGPWDPKASWPRRPRAQPPPRPLPSTTVSPRRRIRFLAGVSIDP